MTDSQFTHFDLSCQSTNARNFGLSRSAYLNLQIGLDIEYAVLAFLGDRCRFSHVLPIIDDTLCIKGLLLCTVYSS